VTPGTLTQLGPLARRSIMRAVRQPQLLASGLIFPLFLYGMNVGGLEFATSLPGFPTESYETFALPFTLVFAGIYAVSVAGSHLGEDIRTGFIKRQTLTPLRGSVLLFGHLAGVVAFAVAQTVIFLAVGFAVGAKVEAGPGGAVLIVLLVAFYALALGSVGLMVALMTRSGEAVQSLFPLLTGMLLLSSVNLPRELIQIDWYQTLTTYNPLSYLVEAPRSLMVEGWDAQPLALGLLVTASILVSSLVQTSTSLRAMAVAR
jgi:ABC-2 type transport system permease protein